MYENLLTEVQYSTSLPLLLSAFVNVKWSQYVTLYFFLPTENQFQNESRYNVRSIQKYF